MSKIFWVTIAGVVRGAGVSEILKAIKCAEWKVTPGCCYCLGELVMWFHSITGA